MGGGKKGAKKQKTGAGQPQAAAATAGGAPSLSIAIPGSIVEDADMLELATSICGQVARVAAAFSVDEIVVYDDGGITDADDNTPGQTVSAATAFLARLLQYLETPPYLRQQLCPPHGDLAHANALPPMGMLHHPQQSDWARFREGIVLREEKGKGCFVDVGLDRTAFTPEEASKGTRVTLDLGEQANAVFMPDFSETMLQAKLCTPEAPRAHDGLYRGYRVRLARSLHRVFKDCPYKAGYLSIGTSVNGVAQDLSELKLPRSKHVLVAFGGHPAGLAEIMEREAPMAHKTPEDQFNMLFNVCPGQGTAVLRTEDVLPMALACLMPAILKHAGGSS